MTHPAVTLWLEPPETRSELSDPAKFVIMSFGPGTVYDQQGNPHEISELRSVHPPEFLDALVRRVAELVGAIEQERVDEARRAEALRRLKGRRMQAALIEVREFNATRRPTAGGMSDEARAHLAVANQTLAPADETVVLLERLLTGLEQL